MTDDRLPIGQDTRGKRRERLAMTWMNRILEIMQHMRLSENGQRKMLRDLLCVVDAILKLVYS